MDLQDGIALGAAALASLYVVSRLIPRPQATSRKPDVSARDLIRKTKRAALGP